MDYGLKIWIKINRKPGRAYTHKTNANFFIFFSSYSDKIFIITTKARKISLQT